MEEKKKRSSDAEAIAALIWLAFIVPEGTIPLEDDGKAYCSFHRALDLYADARERERAELEAERGSIEADRQQLLQEAEAAEHFADAGKMVPDPDTVPAAQPPDTHTHTQAGAAAPKTPGEADSPAHFAGKGGGEKQRILSRLLTYRAVHGLGSYAKVAAATNGALSADEIRDMADCGRHPLAQWRILAAALDWLEQQK